MRLTAILFAFLALAACDGAKKAAPSAPAAPDVEVREVAAADAYGDAGEIVSAVAFWSHPSVNFQGLVIASTADGLKSFDIESGTLISAARDTGETGAVGVFYAGAKPARGYAIAAAGNGYVVRAIDNETRAFSPVSVEMGAPATEGFCAGKRGDGVALYEIGDAGLSLRQIDVVGDRIALGDPQSFVSATGVASCHVDDRDGAVVTIGADGAIRRIDATTGESFGLAFVDGAKADDSALLLSTGVADEAANGGAIAALESASGVIRLFDLADGHALGAVRIKSTFDLKAIASAKAIAFGYGNYGGVYRDGILAVVANGQAGAEQPPIRLVPWTGVLAALQLPLGENVDPRDPSPAEADESVIDIEFIEP